MMGGGGGEGDEILKTVNFGGKLNFILYFLFFLSDSATATYIFTLLLIQILSLLSNLMH
jgi:hypothetical protein